MGRRMSQSPPASSLDMLIVGAGFAGLYMLHKARRMGLKAQVIEAAPSVGGTWYHNRYPGARVDIQSMEYSFSFDEALQQEWHWSERYAPQAELLRYANHVADRFGLRDGIRLYTRIAGAHFDEGAKRWPCTPKAARAGRALPGDGQRPAVVAEPARLSQGSKRLCRAGASHRRLAARAGGFHAASAWASSAPVRRRCRRFRSSPGRRAS